MAAILIRTYSPRNVKFSTYLFHFFYYHLIIIYTELSLSLSLYTSRLTDLNNLNALVSSSSTKWPLYEIVV